MKKEFKSIMAFMGLETLCADSDGGVYMVEAMVNTLEEKCGEALASAETAVQNATEIVALKAQIEKLNTDHAAALAAKDKELAATKDDLTAANEKVTALEAAKAHLDEEVGKLNTEHTAALAAKDKELTTAKASLEEANGKVTALEAQVAEMAAAAPEPQVPAAAPAAGAQAAPKAYAEMTTAEKAQYEKEQRRRK